LGTFLEPLCSCRFVGSRGFLQQAMGEVAVSTHCVATLDQSIKKNSQRDVFVPPLIGHLRHVEADKPGPELAKPSYGPRPLQGVEFMRCRSTYYGFYLPA
jgi:hypothetical protein